MNSKAPQLNAQVRQGYVGKVKKVDMDGLDVFVEVKDARFRYGHIDVLVTPVKGSGEKWITAERLQ